MAAAIGVPWEPADGLVTVSLKVAALVPAESRGPGESFGPSLEPAGGASPGDRLLTLLGRDPAWR